MSDQRPYQQPFTDPRDPRFCVCGAERGHWGWWWPYCTEKAMEVSERV
jgi:hypothetical protein